MSATAAGLRGLLLAGSLGALLATAAPARAVYQCGGTQDTCKCGANNPYPCCENNSNCTWWAWHSMCCNWGLGPGNWGNANTWAQNAAKNGNFEVVGQPKVGSVATRKSGTWGHVAWVHKIEGDYVFVSEQNCNCCGGFHGSSKYHKSWFDSGYIIKKGSSAYCGDGGCNNGENCSSCPGDCGSCCGNGACDWGENCSSCSKDCGSCCGNGACDWGENCSTCQKDCGKCCGNGACDFGETCPSCPTDCHCLPEGGLDLVTCTNVSGWAWDPDNGAQKVQVEVRVDGSTVTALEASGGYPGHDGQGFQWTPPKELRNGSPHEVAAVAFDTQGQGTTTLGGGAFLCDNRGSTEGIWRTLRVDAAGIDVLLPADPPPDLSLRHHHPEGWPYPIGGATATCAVLAEAPADEVRVALGWDLSLDRFSATLHADGDAWKTLAQGGGQETEAVFQGPVSELCLETVALAQEKVVPPQHIELGDLRFRLGSWWATYDFDTKNLIAARPEEDRLQVAARGAGPARGAARLQRDFGRPFDAVSFRITPFGASLGGAGEAAAEVLVDGAPLSIPAGDSFLPSAPGQTLGFQVRLPEEAEVAEGFRVEMADVRVHRLGEVEEGEWRFEHLASWGLDAGTPEVGPDESGLRLRFEHEPPGWWSTGAVAATWDVPGGPFERVRGKLDRSFPSGAFRLDLRVGEDLAWRWDAAATRVEPFEIAAAGETLTFVFGLESDRLLPLDAWAEVSDLELLRGGFWTAPSPDCAGLRDFRPEPGVVRLESSRAWGLEGNPVRGWIRAHRTFGEAQTGVRFSYSQDLSTEAYRVLVLLDRVPAKVIEEHGEAGFDVEVTGDVFHDLAFALVPKGEGGVWPYRWFAEARDVEVLGADGLWRPALEVPEGDGLVPVSAPITETLAAADAGASADVSPGIAAGGASPASSGCDGGPGGGSIPLAALALAFVIGSARRRRATGVRARA